MIKAYKFGFKRKELSFNSCAILKYAHFKWLNKNNSHAFHPNLKNLNPVNRTQL